MPADNEAPVEKRSKLATFAWRSASSLVLWTVVLGSVFSGNKLISDTVFLIVVLGLASLGLREFYLLTGDHVPESFRTWGLFGGALLICSTFFYLSGAFGLHRDPARAGDFESCFLILFVLGLCLRRFVSGKSSSGVVAMSVTLFGLMYVPWLLNFIQKINFFPGIQGSYYVLYFIVVTKFSDLGAYAVGSLIGRHKMIPRISPGKTWEGFGGAIVVSTLASVLLARSISNHLTGMTVLHSVILGVTLSSTAVVGDLVESLFKREAGAKDSGRLFPGIGGVLDLLDSLLFNAPLMYLYLRHILID